MRHHAWPQIQQLAATEAKKREDSWPAHAEYVPVEHKDKIWGVTAMMATLNGDLRRVVMMTIGNDGEVAAYQRYWKGDPVPEFTDEMREGER